MRRPMSIVRTATIMTAAELIMVARNANVRVNHESDWRRENNKQKKKTKKKKKKERKIKSGKNITSETKVILKLQKTEGTGIKSQRKTEGNFQKSKKTKQEREQQIGKRKVRSQGKTKQKKTIPFAGNNEGQRCK